LGWRVVLISSQFIPSQYFRPTGHSFPGLWSLTLCMYLLIYSLKLKKTSLIHLLSFSTPYHSASKLHLAWTPRNLLCFLSTARRSWFAWLPLSYPGVHQVPPDWRRDYKALLVCFLSLRDYNSVLLIVLYLKMVFFFPHILSSFLVVIVDGIVWYHVPHHGQKQKSEIIIFIFFTSHLLTYAANVIC